MKQLSLPSTYDDKPAASAQNPAQSADPTRTNHPAQTADAVEQNGSPPTGGKPTRAAPASKRGSAKSPSGARRQSRRVEDDPVGAAEDQSTSVAGREYPGRSTDTADTDADLQSMLHVARMATTLPRRRLASWFAQVRKEGDTLPRRGLGYAERSILAAAGIPYEVYIFDPALRSMMANFGARIALSVSQAPAVPDNDNERTIAAIFRAQLDEMEMKAIPVPRYHEGHARASLQAVADLLGAPRSLLANYGGLQVEMRRRLNEGRLVLGDVWVDPRKLTKAQRRVLRGRMDAVLARYMSERAPIPAHPERWDKIWFDHMLDEAGIQDPYERDMVVIDKRFRLALTRVMDVVGLKPVRPAAAGEQEPTYGDLLVDDGVALALVRQDYRLDHPELAAGSDQEARWVANELSALRRFMRKLELSDDDSVSAGFAEKGFEERVRAGFTDSRTGNGNFSKSMARWRGVVARIDASSDLPATFHGAFARAMSNSGLDARELAERMEAPRKLIYSWRLGQLLPTYGTEHFVARAEVALGLAPGTLQSRLGELYSGHRAKIGEVTLADGRKVRLSGMWRQLPVGAASWPEERLVPEVEKALARRNGPNTVSKGRLSQVRNNAYNLPEHDPGCAIWPQFEDLVAFKTGATGEDRATVASVRWKTDDSIRTNRITLDIFSRWCAMSKEDGGLGLLPHQITLALVLNPAVVKAYICWRIYRAKDVKLAGEADGERITGSELAAASLFAGLLHPEHGYMRQSRTQMGSPDVIDVQFEVPFLELKKSGPRLDWDRTTTHTVMCAERVATIERDWVEGVASSRRILAALRSDMHAAHKAIRETDEKIMPILRHDRPIAVLLRMIAEARKRVRPLETSPVRHARDYQRIVAMLMLVLVVFRSGTLRNLRWTGDATGDLILMPGEHRASVSDGLLWVPEHFDVVVGSAAFKNSMNYALFGPSWKPRDYEKTMSNWGEFTPIMKHFLEVCRPILLDGRRSDLLFPPPARATEWSGPSFSQMVKEFTKTWCVYNPRFETGMPGVNAFGPHIIRNIVATDIVRNIEGPERWEIAARVLGTGVDQVRDRYGWVDQRREIAKANVVYDEAHKLAASSQPLWLKEV